MDRKRRAHSNMPGAVKSNCPESEAHHSFLHFVGLPLAGTPGMMLRFLRHADKRRPYTAETQVCKKLRCDPESVNQVSAVSFWAVVGKVRA